MNEKSDERRYILCMWDSLRLFLSRSFLNYIFRFINHMTHALSLQYAINLPFLLHYCYYHLPLLT